MNPNYVDPFTNDHQHLQYFQHALSPHVFTANPYLQVPGYVQEQLKHRTIHNLDLMSCSSIPDSQYHSHPPSLSLLPLPRLLCLTPSQVPPKPSRSQPNHLHARHPTRHYSDRPDSHPESPTNHLLKLCRIAAANPFHLLSPHESPFRPNPAGGKSSALPTCLPKVLTYVSTCLPVVCVSPSTSAHPSRIPISASTHPRRASSHQTFKLPGPRAGSRLRLRNGAARYRMVEMRQHHVRRQFAGKGLP